VYGCEGMKFTRVDTYYDDYCKIISPQQVHEACKSGSVGVPRFENMRGWDEFNLQSGSTQGYTVYFGSSKSDKQVRFYDKRAESEGRQDCHRWEVQHTGKQAEAFQEWFCTALTEAMACEDFDASVSRLTDAYKQVIKGAVAFHQMPEGQSIKDRPQNWVARTPLVWWWEELLAGLEPAKLVVNQVAPSLASSVAWFRHQVTPALALIRKVFRHWGIPFTAWNDRELEQGEARWSDRHLKLYQEALITSPAT
jgi:phage replication initiation protein